MKTIQDIRNEQDQKNTELFNSVGLFFAFNNEQLEQGKAKFPLKEGDKYVSIGMGGILPKSNVDAFLDGLELIKKWYKKEVNANKAIRRSLIAYELNNHEAYYTGSISDTLAALGSDFTRKEVIKVYNEEILNHIND